MSVLLYSYKNWTLKKCLEKKLYMIFEQILEAAPPKTAVVQPFTVMVPTLQTIMNSSYYYEYWENIHLCVKLTPV